MKFVMKKNHLEIKFSWKEILLIILRRGHFPMERRSCYEFMTVLAGVITKAIKKYGGAEEHGHLDEHDHPDNYEK